MPAGRIAGLDATRQFHYGLLPPLALCLCILPLGLSAFRDGPVPNMTGGFGEPTCQQCHFDNPLNDPAGTFRLVGVPARYEPLKTYEITASLARREMQRGGFQLAARFASGDQRGKQAGAWRLLDERTQIVAGEDDSGVLFVQHTARGSLAATRGSMSWQVEWTAPGAGGAVEFNAAANAANNDASPLGDYIYVTEDRSLDEFLIASAVHMFRNPN